MNRKKREEIFRRFPEREAEPAPELEYSTAFELLVAVVLSAQATDVSVNKATGKLFKRAKTPAAILKLGETGLKRYIKTIGLFNSKAKNIVETRSPAVGNIVTQRVGRDGVDEDIREPIPDGAAKIDTVHPWQEEIEEEN